MGRSNKMRIAYVTMHWPRFAASGVGKKINRQIKAWRDSGHIVELFNHMHSLEDKSLLLNGKRFEYDLGTGQFATIKTEVNRIKAVKALIESVLEFEPDIIYMRWSIYTYPIHRLLNHISTVVEINTVDTSEYRALGGIYALYNRLTRSIILSKVAGIVFITEQMRSMPDFTRFKKPSATIANSINLDTTSPFPAPANTPPHLLFIGTPGMAWHGVDKLMVLAKSFPDLEIDIVGISELQGLRNLPGNLHLYGYLQGEALEKVMRNADAAIGSLSLHLIDIYEGSTLKILDYISRGIPCILPYFDVNLTPLNSEYFLQIPNNEANIQTHGQAIRDFVYRMRGQRVPCELIAGQVDTKIKESERLKFFRQILGMNHP